MTNIKIQQRSISFAASKAKFSNGTLQVDSSSNESILDKKFKYEIELPGVIHTTARKNNVGGGLNELNLKKETNFAVSEPNAVKKKKVTFANPEISDNVTEHQPTLTEYMMQKEREAKKSNPFKTMRETMPVYENVNAFDDMFEQNNHQKSSDSHQAQAAGELETIKFLKTPSKKEREDLGFSPKQQDNHKVESSKKTYNPLDWNPIYQGKKRFSPERLNVHPLLRNKADIYGSLIAGTKPYSAIERYMITHDGSELETKIERKDGFQSDPSIKHIKVDAAVCSITKGNDKKGVRPDASYKQEPLSEVSKVNVKGLANRFRG